MNDMKSIQRVRSNDANRYVTTFNRFRETHVPRPNDLECNRNVIKY